MRESEGILLTGWITNSFCVHGIPEQHRPWQVF